MVCVQGASEYLQLAPCTYTNYKKKGVKDVKKIATLITTVVMSIFFCTSFFINTFSVSAADGGGGHRGDIIELDRADLDTEKTQAQINSDFINDFTDNTNESLEDLFYYALGTVGAVFSDDTTVKSVKNQYNAIYANALNSPEEMRKIFYYGTDGQLYFTDEFLSQFRNLVDKSSFEQGVFSVPCVTNDKMVQTALSYGVLAVTNAVTSCLNGSDFRLMQDWDTQKYFNDGFSFSAYYPVLAFQSFSRYSDFCNNKVSYTVSTSFYSLSDSGAALLSLPEQIDPWYCVPSSSGTYSRTSDTYYGSSFPAGKSVFDVYPSYYNVGNCPHFWGLGSFEAYRSVDWLKFYTSGGTGVIRGNTYYALDNKQDKDNIFGKDWKTYYQGLQKQYKQLAGEVAAGNKTLKEINETLSNDILDSVADVAQSVAQQTNYLKKILDEVKSISGKLTYSNVVGTVSAASNLLSAICDGLDSLFGGEDGGVFSLLDFVENYVLDGAGNTAASIMKKSFPFSVPHDFYLILELFSVDAKVPQVNFSFDLKRLGLSYDYSYTANDFQKLAYMTRFFSSVGFVMVLINLTNKILKK